MDCVKQIRLILKAVKNIIIREYNRLAVMENPKLQALRYQQAGLDIADDVIFFGGTSIVIDVSRPSLVHIGHNVFLHNNFKLFTHDWASHVFLAVYNTLVNSSGSVIIGDNVWFGENVTVLKGSHIGNNCIIGINSVVIGNIPDNSVAV